MKQEDSLNKSEKNKYTRQAIAADNLFARAFALYRSRVYERYYTLFMTESSGENSEDSTATR